MHLFTGSSTLPPTLAKALSVSSVSGLLNELYLVGNLCFPEWYQNNKILQWFKLEILLSASLGLLQDWKTAVGKVTLSSSFLALPFFPSHLLVLTLIRLGLKGLWEESQLGEGRDVCSWHRCPLDGRLGPLRKIPGRACSWGLPHVSSLDAVGTLLQLTLYAELFGEAVF